MFEDKREREITFPSCEKVFLYLLNVIVIITIIIQNNKCKIDLKLDVAPLIWKRNMSLAEPTVFIDQESPSEYWLLTLVKEFC